LLKRAFREQDAAFLVEGAQAVREAIADAEHGGGRVRELFVTSQARTRHPDLVARATALGVPIHLGSGHVLAQLSETVTPQGLVAVCDLRDVSLESVAAQQPRLAVVLAAIRDPGNAGTVLRTADGAGAGSVLFADGSVDPYNGKCVRASAGSLFHLPIVRDIPLAQAVAAMRQAGLQVFAAAGGGDADLDAIERGGGLDSPTVWVFGNEAWGLPDDVLAVADRVVRVPIYGRAESLNLAAAAAVCLYASARAHHRPADE